MKQWQFTYSYLGALSHRLQSAEALAGLRHSSNNFVLGSVSEIVAGPLLLLCHLRRNPIATPLIAGLKEF